MRMSKNITQYKVENIKLRNTIYQLKGWGQRLFRHVRDN